MLGAAPPSTSHSLAAHTLPFRALAALAGDAAVGGDREVVMACFMTARLLAAAVEPVPPPIAERAERAQAARSWLAALALPAVTRIPFARAADASATDDRTAMAQALGLVIEATAHVLDRDGRRELEDLGERMLDRG